MATFRVDAAVLAELDQGLRPAGVGSEWTLHPK
jgi:hypothetical protein